MRVPFAIASVAFAVLGVLGRDGRADSAPLWAEIVTCFISTEAAPDASHDDRAAIHRELGARDLRAFGHAAAIRGPLARGARFSGQPSYVAFTFDDGPDAETTPAVIAALDHYNIPATFFVVGHRLSGTNPGVPLRRQVLRDIASRGHHIGNHTFHHVDLTLATDEELRDEIDKTDEVLRRELGYKVHAFRPPFGRIDARGRAHLRERGMTEIRWSIDSKDFSAPSSRHLRARVLAEILEDQGGVVLLHDTKEVTAAAIAGILDDLEAENCRRLSSGEIPIIPVSIHYFVRNFGGSVRPVPPEVEARTRRYMEELPARCRARPASHPDQQSASHGSPVRRRPEPARAL